MTRPLAIDLYCGLGGWTEGLLAAGYDVVGFDNEVHQYGDHKYPAQLVVQDVRTIDGARFKDAALIVASPPCTEYSYMAMPWKRARAIARALRGEGAFPDGYTGSRTLTELNRLFDECFRIQREATAAAGRTVPLIVENVKGAQPWVGRARWSYGSFYLWGDVPALMPIARRGAKNPGQDWNRFKQTGEVSPHWRLEGMKNTGGSCFSQSHGKVNDVVNHPDGWERNRDDPRDGIKIGDRNEHRASGGHKWSPHWTEGVKHPASGREWFDTGPASLPSGSSRRKAASALIAKIPLALAHYIGSVYAP